LQTPEQLSTVAGQIECEQPSPDLQNFLGRMKVIIHTKAISFPCISTNFDCLGMPVKHKYVGLCMPDKYIVCLSLHAG
jgi:hypothetical protein